MAAVDDPKTLGRTRLSFASHQDVTEFAQTLAKFESGEITSEQWRAFRLVRGTYGQRQDGDAQMLRVKIPQGILNAAQLRALAEVGEKYSRGFGHITTRQNIQFHFVKLHDVEKAMALLADAGVTMREACGNAVRNITGCVYAGVAKDEPFDVTPYAEALTRYLLRHPLSATMPRKFKIGFEGCQGEDHALALIQDLGFKARIVDGNKGFRLHAGGGTAIKCTEARVLYDFLPAGEILDVAEAVVRVFHRLGDRQHRQRNRMKFLIAQLGWDAWVAEVEKERDNIRAEGGAKLPFDPNQPPVEQAPTWVRAPAMSNEELAVRAAATKTTGPGLHPEVKPQLSVQPAAFERWRRTNVRAQKQAGYSVVLTTIPLGDFTSAQMRVLGDLAEVHGDGLVRVTQDQNLVYRWVKDEQLPAFYAQLSAAGLGLADAGTTADVTSCPGAEACRLAVTQSRGLGKLLSDFLRERPELADLAPDVNIKVSGCPNGCGLHHIAGIGFQGSIRKVGAKVVPQYFVMLGGNVGPQRATFGRISAKVPARRIPQVVERLLKLYAQEKLPGETGTSFFQRVELPKVKALLSDLEALTEATATPEDYVDLGETQEFVHVTMEGECAA